MKKGFRKEMEFMNKSNANKQNLVSWDYMWKFKLSSCIMNVSYCTSALTLLCQSHFLETEFIGHETRSGLIMSVRKKKSK